MKAIKGLEMDNIKFDSEYEQMLVDNYPEIVAYHYDKEHHRIDIYSYDNADFTHYLNWHWKENEWQDEGTETTMEYLLSNNVEHIKGCDGCHCCFCTGQGKSCCNKCIAFREYHEGSDSDNGFCTDECEDAKKYNYQYVDTTQPLHGTSEMNKLKK